MTAASAPPTFALTGPLPGGTQVIEASAGTGKTYTIVSLAVRFVAEKDIPLADVMLVTFGRAATQELRERARERFAQCAEALSNPASARDSDDAVISFLASGSDREVAQRGSRLRRALSQFDTATIVTTHAFCQRMLDGVGIAGDYQPDAAFRENVADIVGQVSDDRYIGDYAGAAPPPMSAKLARTITEDATDDPQAQLVPADADPGTPAAERVAFAEQARTELNRRKRRLGVRDYNDLLVLLRDALADPVYGPIAQNRIRSRYRVVLVDEFQDTDPLQWEILSAAFHGVVTLILVGDPKQAIYAFRGADVMTYLEAIGVAGNISALDVNRRTDEGLMRALDRIYLGAALGPDEIVVHPVTAHHKDARVTGTAPLRLRYLSRGAFGNPSKNPGVGVVRPRIAGDLAHDIVSTLTTGQQILDGEIWRDLEPSDIAVLVRNRDQGSLICDALTNVAVPSVLSGGASVFTTVASTAWQRLLAALEQPHRSGLVRLAALSPLVGFTAAELDAGGDALVAVVSAQLRSWVETFERFGAAALFEVVSAWRDLDARQLAVEGGERILTDLRHLAQMMNRVVAEDQLGLTSLSTWLASRCAEERNAATSDRSRLLDREAAAVRVITIHTSKGLQFPIVYLPYCWDFYERDKPDTFLLHAEGRRQRDVGGRDGPGYSDRLASHRLEEAGEELRVFYVAATRAQSRVVAWWVPTDKNTRGSPLHRLLFGRTDGQAQPDPKPALPQDAVLGDRFAEWVEPLNGFAAVEAIPPVIGTRSLPPRAHNGEALEVARFARALDWSWQRTSYTRLTTHDDPAARALSEVEEAVLVDEPPIPSEPDAATAVENSAPSLMNDFTGGTTFGILVHEVLQRIDTSVTDLTAEVRARTREVVTSRSANVNAEQLATALSAVMRTPIPGGTLGAVASADRLVEVEFELPLAGGDQTRQGAASLTAIADLLETHLTTDDSLRAYPGVLRTIPGTLLMGYLTGSIDAVLRFEGPRYVIVDYKTNKLFPGPVDATQFDQASMTAEMIRHHYPLQALLYSVALHRYLRWRQPGYLPEEHLGGVQYLFVRAMVGESTPRGCGVFAWNPSPTLIAELSDLLAAR
jgi:exodeoxyribonuclease V beta subunit